MTRDRDREPALAPQPRRRPDGRRRRSASAAPCGNYCGGLNSGATIDVERNAGWGAGEAMASGKIVVERQRRHGDRRLDARRHDPHQGLCGARAAASRMKGGTLIVEGDVGYLVGVHDPRRRPDRAAATTGAALRRLALAGQRLGGRARSARSAPTRTWSRPTTRTRRACTGCCARNGVDGTFTFKQGRLRAEALVLQQPQPRRLAEDLMDETAHPTPGYDQGRSHIWTAETIRDIHAKAELGRYQIRGFSTFQKLPDARRPRLPAGRDDAAAARGLPRALRDEDRDRRRPPDLVARAARARHPGLPDVDELRRARHERQAWRSAWASRAPARRPARARAACCPRSARPPTQLIYQMTPSRYGLDLEHLRMADAIEIVLGQGAKPGTGGMLLGMKVSREGRADAHRCRSASTSARPRATPTSWAATTSRSRSRSCARRPTTACRSSSSSPPAASSRTSRSPPRPGCDAIVVDGTEGSTAASPEFQLDHTGIPTLDGDPGRAPRARGDRHVRQGHADRLGRHPQRRRRRQGARARRRLRRDRHRRR